MEKINSNNLLPLDLIANNFVKKRIVRDTFLLEEKYLSVFFYIDDKLGLPVLMIVDEKFKYNNIYTIIINNNYPFTAPIVKINFKSYYSFLKLNNKSLHILKNIHYKDCLCCSSILCTNNWVPSYTINNIIQEIRKNKSYKRDIVYKIILNKIKEKYLIEDINLDNWLF
jgi:ubiquitin-protein ligase